jgi:hypothetical protein
MRWAISPLSQNQPVCAVDFPFQKRLTQTRLHFFVSRGAIMSRELGEKCVEIARQVRDGEYPQRDLGKLIAEHEANCLECGCYVVVVEYEHGTDGGYCQACHQQISQAIYDHECGLLASGYYG